MKTLKHISAFLLLVPLLASCHLLEVEKTGKTSIKNFYSDIYALDAAVNGVYGLTYKFYDNYMVLYPEVAGDLVRLQATTSDWRQQFDFISDESDETTAVGYIWKNGYEIIANANEVIQYGPSVSDRFPQQAASVRNYIAQAYFIRALIHLDLSLVYGQTYTYSADGSHLGTAVMTTIPDVKSKIARSTAAVTYKRILDDIQTASDMFADGWTKGCYYASPAACKALMARVYLYMGNYSEAKKCASEVIADYGLSLTPRSDYVAMFCARKEGTEAILRLNGLSGGDEFSGVCMKFTDTEDIDDTQKRYDPFVLRLSEMYLIRAEAACHDGDIDTAVSDIAALEARARGVKASEINVVYSNAEELDRIIRRERVKELFLEGHRLFDLTRRHETLSRDAACGSSVLSMTYPDDRFILPIPLVELDANKAMQPNPINGTQR